jgi:hypothetical protein
MRRRSRHTSTCGEPPERPATTVDDAPAQLDPTLDTALRALARLLARQAARDIFERECAHERPTPDATPEKPEGLP